MGMSQAYGVRDDAGSLATIELALEIGVNFLDTADMYGAGHNEELVGRAVRVRRRGLVLATKCGFVWGEDGQSTRLDGSPRHIFEACEASLRRLRVETIDLYYLHRVDPRVPLEKSVGAMAELVSQGKVRFLGLSEVSASELRRAHAVHPITALQSEYSLWTRDVEAEVLPACRELGVGFVAYAPLGRGLFTGRVKDPRDFAADDMRRRIPRFLGESFQKNLALAACVAQLAAGKGCTAAQFALAWVLARGDDVVPIPGTKRREYLEENVGALAVSLDAEEMRKVDEIMPPGAAAGSRHTEQMLRILNP
jgi:aryl-alcohol dehydrogenase-like predicted oxidoreductase